MPAETHQQRDAVDVPAVLDLVAALLDIDPEGAGDRTLVELALDDDITQLDLWASVAEELGERSLGDFEPPDPPAATLAELAAGFREALGP